MAYDNDSDDMHGSGAFPTMGCSAAMLSASPKPERGRARTRGVAGMGGSDKGLGTKANRSARFGSMGATNHPTATLYEANSAEANKTGQRVHQMPSRASWTGQWRGAASKLGNMGGM